MKRVDKRIPVAEPALVGNERRYVLECLRSGWVSSRGPFVGRFEEELARYLGVRHAISCCNGTAALHLALLAVGIRPGDDVLVPTLTYVSTAYAVLYCGARPIFVDSDPHHWGMDPHDLETNLTARSKAIIVVHLYGIPVDLDPILDLARRRGLVVIEDAAEALGAEYRGRKIGSLGDLATFSFYGNKVITAGEGGMVTTNDEDLAERVRRLDLRAGGSIHPYWSAELGYNYRMSNLSAAVGLAQLESIDWQLARRHENAVRYRESLRMDQALTWPSEPPESRPSYWMNSLLVNANTTLTRDTVIEVLRECQIETRPFFYPLHRLPIFRSEDGGRDFPIADRLSAEGISLPSSARLTGAEIKRVANAIRSILHPGVRFGETDSHRASSL